MAGNRLTRAWDAFKATPTAINSDEIIQTVTKNAEAFFSQRNGSGGYLFSTFFNGEKSLGGIGPVKNNFLDYEALRSRSWDGYLTNEIVQIIINRMTIWCIGTGLRIQSEPNLRVLNQDGIKIDKDILHEFTEEVEARFSVYAETVLSDYAGMQNLNQKMSTVMKNAKTGGDVLVVLRYINGFVKIQLIDGCHVRSQQGGTDWSPQIVENGNRIMNGVEMNERGEHVAYWVQNDDLSWSRIMARSKQTGLKLAFFVGGLDFRLDNSRKIPATAAILETLAVLDRYKDATLQSAEEQNNIALKITHKLGGEGATPFIKNAAIAQRGGTNAQPELLPQTFDGVQLANHVTATTKKQAVNLPVEADLGPIDKNESELYFKEFYSTFIDLMCAAFGIPPEVAMSKYDSNFSSARAAIKDWEHTLLVERYNFTCDFLQPVYDFWLHTSVFENKIQAPGYIKAFMDGNDMLLCTYRKIRAIGDPVPHIDPVKEATAERIKLGELGAALPLTTQQNSTEKLGEGDAASNTIQFAKEKNEAETLGIKEEILPTVKPGKINAMVEKYIEKQIMEQ